MLLPLAQLPPLLMPEEQVVMEMTVAQGERRRSRRKAGARRG